MSFQPQATLNKQQAEIYKQKEKIIKQQANRTSNQNKQLAWRTGEGIDLIIFNGIIKSMVKATELGKVILWCRHWSAAKPLRLWSAVEQGVRIS